MYDPAFCLLTGHRDLAAQAALQHGPSWLDVEVDAELGCLLHVGGIEAGRQGKAGLGVQVDVGLVVDGQLSGVVQLDLRIIDFVQFTVHTVTLGKASLGVQDDVGLQSCPA